MNAQQRAGRSAFKEGKQRRKAASQTQKWLALLACFGSVILAAVFVGWLYAFAALGVVFLVGATVVLVNQSFAPPEVKGSWNRGSVGEQLTERVLARLNGRQFLVIHDVAMGATNANIDHLVIGPTGVFVLDSKNWRGKAAQDKNGVWKYGAPVEKTAQATIAERDWIIKFLQPEVSAWQVPVQVAWVMTGTSQVLTSVGDVDIVDLDKLLDYIVKRPQYVSRGRAKQLFHRASTLRPAK